MGPYEMALCRVYAPFLLTVYFEFFSELLAVPTDVLQRVKKLRRALTMIPRWPEMVTFEEMNTPLPERRDIFDIVFRLMFAEMYEDGFVAGAESERKPTPTQRR
jgi:hypothetical protein